MFSATVRMCKMLVIKQSFRRGDISFIRKLGIELGIILDTAEFQSFTDFVTSAPATPSGVHPVSS